MFRSQFTERGSVLSFKVVIGERFTCRPYTKLTTALTDDLQNDDNDSDEDGESL